MGRVRSRGAWWRAHDTEGGGGASRRVREALRGPCMLVGRPRRASGGQRATCRGVLEHFGVVGQCLSVLGGRPSGMDLNIVPLSGRVTSPLREGGLSCVGLFTTASPLVRRSHCRWRSRSCAFFFTRRVRGRDTNLPLRCWCSRGLGRGQKKGPYPSLRTVSVTESETERRDRALGPGIKTKLSYRLP